MRANVEHNHVLAEHVIILSVETEPVPRIPDSERMTHDDLGYASDGIVHVAARFGYMERPNVPRALALLDPEETEGPIDLGQRVLLPVQARAVRGRLADDGAVAQAAVHRDVPHHRRRRRALRPAARPHGHRRLPASRCESLCPFAAQPRKTTHRIALYMYTASHAPATIRAMR